jgi:hypothetical protein
LSPGAAAAVKAKRTARSGSLVVGALPSGRRHGATGVPVPVHPTSASASRSRSGSSVARRRQSMPVAAARGTTASGSGGGGGGGSSARGLVGGASQPAVTVSTTSGASLAACSMTAHRSPPRLAAARRGVAVSRLSAAVANGTSVGTSASRRGSLPDRRRSGAAAAAPPPAPGTIAAGHAGYSGPRLDRDRASTRAPGAHHSSSAASLGGSSRAGVSGAGSGTGARRGAVPVGSCATAPPHADPGSAGGGFIVGTSTSHASQGGTSSAPPPAVPSAGGARRLSIGLVRPVKGSKAVAAPPSSPLTPRRGSNAGVGSGSAGIVL